MSDQQHLIPSKSKIRQRPKPQNDLQNINPRKRPTSKKKPKPRQRPTKRSTCINSNSDVKSEQVAVSLNLNIKKSQISWTEDETPSSPNAIEKKRGEEKIISDPISKETDYDPEDVSLSPHTLRLLRLIEKGTQNHARYAAALLGKITSSSSCVVLWDILGRIQRFLLHPSSSWDTRQNAALAITNVAKNIPILDQYHFLSETGPSKQSSTSSKNSNEDSGLWLSVNDFIASNNDEYMLDVILNHGRLLLSHNGTKYDIDCDEYEKEREMLKSLDQSSISHYHNCSTNTNANVDSKKIFLQERIELQRNILVKRLGLAVLFHGANGKNMGMRMKEFITDDDLILKPFVKHNEKNQDANNFTLISKKRSLTSLNSDYSKSIREKKIDQLRKKRKSEYLKMNQDDTDNLMNNDKSCTTMRALLVLEMKKTSIQEKNNSFNQAISHKNPQILLATDFIYHMFDPDWKVRHGAFLGTLSLLRAWKFNKRQTKSQLKDSFVFGRWPDDILSRCLCTLILDRFCDYAGGTIFINEAPDSIYNEHSYIGEMDGIISVGMMAPVRESAAQLLSIVLSAAPRSTWENCWRVVLKMVQCKMYWEVRHGGFLAMKYIAALLLPLSITYIYPSTEKGHGDFNRIPEYICRDMMKAAVSGLLDSSDDIKSVAAQVLRCLCILNRNRDYDSGCVEVIKACSNSLWKAISMLHNVSACAIDLLALFSLLIRYNSNLVLSYVNEDSKPLYMSENTNSTNFSIDVMVQVMQKLAQLLEFDSTSVQLSSLFALSSVCKPVAYNFDIREEELDRLLASYCGLLSKLFECFFDSLIIEHINTKDKDIDKVQIDKKRRRLVEARQHTWDSIADSLICLLSSLQNIQSKQHQNKSYKLINQLVVDLILRLIGIVRKKERVYASNEERTLCSTSHFKNIVHPLDNSTTIYRVPITCDDLFCSQVLASRSLAKLCSKLHFLFTKDQDDTSNSNLPFLSLAIQSLISSPWAFMLEGGCLLFKNFLLLSNNESLIESTIAKDCHHMLISMNTYAASSIIACTDANFAAIKDDPKILSAFDSSLVKFLDKASFITLTHDSEHMAVDDFVSKWKKIFIANHIDSFTFESVKIEQCTLTVDSMRLSSSVAGAIISAGRDLLPSKLTPLIRSLMTSLRNEKSIDRQEVICHDTLRLIELLSHSSSNKDRKSQICIQVRNKIIENICILCCSEENILKTVIQENAKQETSSSIRLVRMIMVNLKDKTLQDVAPFWKRLEQLVNGNLHFLTESELTPGLQILCILSLALKGKYNILLHAIKNFQPVLVSIACESPSSLCRKQAILAATNFCKANPSHGIVTILPHLFETLHDLTNESRRFSGCNLLQQIVQNVGLDICPFVRYFLPVTMSMMTDMVETCAKLAASIFASLVRVAPLVSNHTPLKYQDELKETIYSSMKSKEFDPKTAVCDKVIDHLIHGKPIPYTRLPDRLEIALRSGNITLRDYQRDGISWMRFLQSVNLSGALCDDMGLGKTLQALIGIGIAHCGNMDDSPASLVVCPSTLVGHWENEISRFFPNNYFFQVLRFDGNASKRKLLWERQIKDVNIVITSYAILRQEVGLLTSNLWTYCVLDEGHLLKNPKTATAKAARRIRSKNKLILTGTPVQNKVNELWAIFDFLMPNFLGNQKTFIKNFAKPIANSQIPGASPEQIGIGTEKLKILHQQVLPFILRREKKQVLKELPEKNIIDIPCAMSKEQIQLYKHIGLNQDVEKNIESLCREIMEGKSSAKLGKDTLQRIMLMRMICTHPLLALTKPWSDSMELDEKYFQLECSGKLLALNDLMRHAGICPDELAGADNDKSSIFIHNNSIVDNISTDDYIEGGPDSFLDQEIDIQAPESNDTDLERRCLIFAQFTRSLDILEEFLLQSHMPSLRYLRLDGNVPPERRSQLVSQFEQDESIKIMLLTTKVGGLGLNLTSADTVIFLELDWNPHVDLQAMDRVHRIGQKKVVNVFRLISSKTIEEVMLKFQREKLKISNAIVNSENSTMYSMGTDRLLDIFTASGDMNTKKNKMNGRGDVFESVDNICSEDEYLSLSVEGFLSALNHDEKNEEILQNVE